MSEKTIDIVFDSAPGPEGPRLIEVEREGRSIRLGEWVAPHADDPAGYWRLVIPDPDALRAEVARLKTVADHHASNHVHAQEAANIWEGSSRSWERKYKAVKDRAEAAEAEVERLKLALEMEQRRMLESAGVPELFGKLAPTTVEAAKRMLIGSQTALGKVIEENTANYTRAEAAEAEVARLKEALDKECGQKDAQFCGYAADVGEASKRAEAAEAEVARLKREHPETVAVSVRNKALEAKLERLKRSEHDTYEKYSSVTGKPPRPASQSWRNATSGRRTSSTSSSPTAHARPPTPTRSA